jgi:hypothetical protein
VTVTDHPAGRRRRCTHDPACTQPAAARITWTRPPWPGTNVLVVQPATGPGKGRLVCAVHAHHLVDVLLSHTADTGRTA